MAFLAKLFRILFFFLILFQVAGMYVGNSLPSHNNSLENFSLTDATDDTSLQQSLAEPTADEVLYSPDKLLLPDALLSPLRSFQFGFIEILACFLFVIFSFYAFRQVKEKRIYFTNAYFLTLFSSVILINAP
jgi:hypothetical protein